MLNFKNIQKYEKKTSKPYPSLDTVDKKTTPDYEIYSYPSIHYSPAGKRECLFTDQRNTGYEG
jgi:hypothetical protein